MLGVFFYSDQFSKTFWSGIDPWIFAVSEGEGSPLTFPAIKIAVKR